MLSNQRRQDDRRDRHQREKARERAREKGVVPEKKTDETDINQVRPDCEERHIQKALLTPHASGVSICTYVLVNQVN